MSFGRAHCKIATLQEAFAMDLQASYLMSIARMEDEIKEYQTQRKKLESRRFVKSQGYTWSIADAFLGSH